MCLVGEALLDCLVLDDCLDDGDLEACLLSGFLPLLFDLSWWCVDLLAVLVCSGSLPL